MKTILISFFILIFFGCKSNFAKDDLTPYNKIVSAFYSNDSLFLAESLEKLEKSHDFSVNGLNEANYDYVHALYRFNRKYTAVLPLLEDFSSGNHLQEYKNKLNINICKFLTSDKKEIAFIEENIQSMEKELLKNPQDSIFYMDYHVMYLYIYSKEEVLSFIDSTRTSDMRFSDFYYNYMLKDVIIEYPCKIVENCNN